MNNYFIKQSCFDGSVLLLSFGFYFRLTENSPFTWRIYVSHSVQVKVQESVKTHELSRTVIRC